MKHTPFTPRNILPLSGNCVTARNLPLTCGKGVARSCVTRNSWALIAALRVALRNRAAYQLSTALTCMFLGHPRVRYAVTQRRETHARPGRKKTVRRLPAEAAR
jgi:hypothetical protein